MSKESSTQTKQLSVRGTKAELKERVGRLIEAPPPVILLLAVPRRLFCFGSLIDFRCGVSLFIVILVIYKNIKIGKQRC